MSQEFEAKFLDVNVSSMRDRLESIGAKLVHEKTKYIRAVFHRCESGEPPIRGFARIRDENGTITMTVKIYKDPKFPEEYEITILDSFEKGIEFLKALGIKQKAFQESYREKWSHELVHEITFDDIPGIPTYMEVDCTGEDKLNKVVDLLKLDKSKMRFGGFDATYNEYYGIPRDVLNDKTPSLTFSNIINEIKPTRNMELLQNLQTKYNSESSKFPVGGRFTPACKCKSVKNTKTAKNKSRSKSRGRAKPKSSGRKSRKSSRK